MNFFVAGGALMFAASLAYCAWSYAVVWGRTAPVASPASIATDVLLFTLFAAHHSVFARPWAQRWLARYVPARLHRSVYVWAASLLLVATCAGWQTVGGLVYRLTGPAALAAALVQAAGVWLSVRSVRLIDALVLAGMRDLTVPAPLQTRGPYRWVRHPLYLGWVLIAFGAARMTGDRLIFAVTSAAYLAVAIPWEERGLVGTFGEGYRDYQREVRWRMLPFLY